MNKFRLDSQKFSSLQRNGNLDWTATSEGVVQEDCFILRWILVSVVQ